MLRYFLFGLLNLLCIAGANAGTQTGKVTKLGVRDSDGLVYFILAGSPAGVPACATHGYWMIKNENSESGKRQLALLIAAQASGKSVVVMGANTCARWPDGEDVDMLSVQD
jgi:hypothetical protein